MAGKRSAAEMLAGWATRAAGSGADALWSSTFTWRIENFSKLTRRDRRRLGMFPAGNNVGRGTHLSVFLEVQDSMWEPTAEFKLAVVNQADASKSHFTGGTDDFTWECSNVGSSKLIRLSELKTAAAGWLINDTLVVKADVTVEREDRFQVETGGGPHDVTLKLPCGAQIPVSSHLLQLASPFFRGVLEDVQGGAPILVDGSLSAWTYILSCVYPFHEQPNLTLSSVHTLLPVVHKYDFTKLLERLVVFVKGKREELDSDFTNKFGSYVICWLALAERLQLDELCELCLANLRSMTREERQDAITVKVEVGSGADKKMKRVARKEVSVRHSLVDDVVVMNSDESDGDGGDGDGGDGDGSDGDGQLPQQLQQQQQQPVRPPNAVTAARAPGLLPPKWKQPPSNAAQGSKQGPGRPSGKINLGGRAPPAQLGPARPAAAAAAAAAAATATEQRVQAGHLHLLSDSMKLLDELRVTKEFGGEERPRMARESTEDNAVSLEGGLLKEWGLAFNDWHPVKTGEVMGWRNVKKRVPDRPGVNEFEAAAPGRKKVHGIYAGSSNSLKLRFGQYVDEELGMIGPHDEGGGNGDKMACFAALQFLGFQLYYRFVGVPPHEGDPHEMRARRAKDVEESMLLKVDYSIKTRLNGKAEMRALLLDGGAKSMLDFKMLPKWEAKARGASLLPPVFD
ncbi:hypothetical protein FOA52_015067 [Chlamydomonas sp. UWO 241]|nr:hypothetical protein FOA52_015067 [Chlamydomonas sp. UWO 241]